MVMQRQRGDEHQMSPSWLTVGDRHENLSRFLVPLQCTTTLPFFDKMRNAVTKHLGTFLKYNSYLNASETVQGIDEWQ